ncbi:hypothetical protein HNR62_002310 [Oceanisphaera litoralis]|uniref:DEAD/DEAH box helicase n=1 Tax=Oceanisphaera litoralis TaxID=225144 RepID=UPI00195E2642|nr:DEAD/DEAH box helicase family protein [Oceanisphaera litoralis]MBM7456424.1 hypothetical protein [Oceanisphaera litoralis]
MRYTLKDYQEDAVAEVLGYLRKAARAWKQEGDISAFSLTATTGAGKTVMAAAAIEALFEGNPEYDFAADPGAVVLWFTDSPALNEQTRAKLSAAADKIDSRLTVIENDFSEEKLAPGHVYFLNAQKLSKHAKLVRAAVEPADDGQSQHHLAFMAPPDDRAHTMWEILKNTIEDENLTLYLVLDEAHRGMKTDRDRTTTVQKLINGTQGAPAVPVVWGISATVERFNKAMKSAQAQGRITYPDVVVDPARVQESGLLKDDIRLDFPANAGAFDTTLLARATRLLRESTERWKTYSASAGADDNPVVPLMVVQMPNTPGADDLRAVFKTIYHEWPELPADAMANVFGEHKDIDAGGFKAPYLPPEMAQDQSHIRVLLAKDAISTGWDCPRAEVFVSFRPARDVTYITQLLGRMVRTPLARRISGNDLLNSVACVLPRFDQETATDVARAMVGDRLDDADGSGGGQGRRVLMNPIDMTPNPAIPNAVWEAFDELPSQTLPRKTARAISRYTALAQALSQDGLRKHSLAFAYKTLCKQLDAIGAMYPDELNTATKKVCQVAGLTRIVGMDGQVSEAEIFTEIADDHAIDAEYKNAARVLTPELAKRYVDHCAAPGDDDSLYDARVKVAAFGKMDVLGLAPVKSKLEEEAANQASQWFSEFRVDIKGLNDQRQAVYADIRSMSSEPQHVSIQRPRIRSENTRDEDGNLLNTRPLHLMADKAHSFPIGSLNEWETRVLDREMSRSHFLAWYRNPPRASSDALSVAWRDANDNWRRMCPDFLFFHGDETDVKVSIVDPHGHHLEDAPYKLIGLANFTEEFGEAFHRIEAIAKIDKTLRVLDLKDKAVRLAIMEVKNAEAVYRSEIASDY